MVSKNGKQNYPRTELKKGDKRSYRVMNWNIIFFLFQITLETYGGGQEPNTMEILSWFEGLGSCQKWTMNTEMYRQIWIHHVIASRKHLIDNSFPFQHDKKRKRMDQCSKRSEKPKQKMQHYQSWIGPDLNIIETVWEHLNKGHSKTQPTPQNELWMSFEKPGELFLKTTLKKDDNRACLTMFCLMWSV